LRDGPNNVTSALPIKLRANQLLRAAAGPPALEKPERFGASSPTAIILSPQGAVLYAAEQVKQGLNDTQAFPDLGQVCTSLSKDRKDNYNDRDPRFVSYHPREENPQLSIFLVEDYSKATSQLELDSYVLLLLTMLLIIVAMLALYYLISSITDS